MRTLRCALAVLAVCALPLPAQAQDGGFGEIIVTGSRVSQARIPPVGMRRTADFAVQRVSITGDTRDAATRHEEIYAMVRKAVDLAGKWGDIELSTGEIVVEPLTRDNVGNLILMDGSRPDTESTEFFVKTRLSAGIDARAALARITAFIAAVPPVGRAQIEAEDDLSLSIVNPNQYRSAIIEMVAADAQATAKTMGDDYAVETSGLARPVQWTRASLTEVYLYLPYDFTIVPRGR